MTVYTTRSQKILTVCTESAQKNSENVLSIVTVYTKNSLCSEVTY